MSGPVRALRWATSPALIVSLIFFGALLDFGGGSSASALFWASLQCACAAYALAWRPETLHPPRRLEVAAAILYLALLAVAALALTPVLPAPLDRYAALVELARLTGLLALCIVGWRVASDEAEATRLFGYLTLGCGLYAAWAIFAFLDAPAFVLGLEKQMHVERLSGSLLSANTAGSLFGAVGCALAVRLMRRIGRRIGSRRAQSARWGRDVGDAALLAVLWLALLLTVSRAAVTVSLAVLGLFLLLELRRYVKRRRLSARSTAFASAAAAAGFLLIVAGSVSSQLEGQFGRLGADAVSRIGILEAYEPLIREVPPFGYGFGAFPTLNASQVTQANFADLWNLGAAHNLLLQWWLEAGPVGTALGAAVLGLVLLRLALRLSGSETGRWRAACALAAAAVLLAHNMVDYSLQAPAIAGLLAILLGFGMGEAKRRPAP
ncbi:MAG: O-antigen ligase family protein [Phenylobacterium sp.]|uniref:O-antigen ligase family protein n=1 Tax=Phenylobacterium sp. TaxID=1871053 RepID=UPI0039190A43